MDYLKVGKATDLDGKDRKLYRAFEILPGFLAWGTLVSLIVLSYFKPVWVAYFIIVFDVYWLLLVLYLGIHLLISFRRMQKNEKLDWVGKCKDLDEAKVEDLPEDCLAKKSWKTKDIIHVVIMPTLGEPAEIIEPSIQAVLDDGLDPKNIIFVLGLEEREGDTAPIKGRILKEKFGDKFRNFLVTSHPDNMLGELKGKGANQAWMAKEVKKEIVDKEALDYDKIMVSVFDCDTVVSPGYFSCLTYLFLTVTSPYRASYQPIPLYHNNIWEVPFYSRVAAYSNSFWQMMQQIRVEKLATYSSHSMTWKALVEIGFWSVNMVSEDSRIYWHCFLHYNGDYRVEPMYFPVSMDSIKIGSNWETLVGLYKQQRRWGWGVENVPYLLFNIVKRWDKLSHKAALDKIFIQVHGFHSWATNALIIAVIGWMPLLIGGERFSQTVLSGNLPMVTRTLMMIAMSGLLFSAIASTLLLPKRPKETNIIIYIIKRILMFFEWLLLPLSIIICGAFPALDSQTRLMLGKYMGFMVTPKERRDS